MRTDAVTLRSEFPRKLLHVGMGAFALLLRWLAPWQAILMALAALVLNSFFLHALTRGTLLRPSERDSRFSRGVVLYPAILLLTFIVFRSRLELAAGVWALLAVGDGMAALSGLTLKGSGRCPGIGKKTWSGLAAFVVFGTAACALGHSLDSRGRARGRLGGLPSCPAGCSPWGGSDASGRIGDAFLMGVVVSDTGAAGMPGSLSLLVIGCFVATTAAAALAESLETNIDDNILVPVVGGAVLWAATTCGPGIARRGLSGHFEWPPHIDRFVGRGLADRCGDHGACHGHGLPSHAPWISRGAVAGACSWPSLLYVYAGVAGASDAGGCHSDRYGL